MNPLASLRSDSFRHSSTPLIAMTAIATAHFLIYVFFVAHAIGADAQGEELSPTGSTVIYVLSMPLMPMSHFAGSTTEVVALAIANGMLWAVCFVGAFGILRRNRRRNDQKKA